MATEKVLEVSDLNISFKTDNGLVRAVRGVSFDLYKGETLCIVGESGSGKSVTSKTIMGILAHNAIIDSGSVMYEGENLLDISEEEYVNIRGKKIGMIFQDPLSSLNPIVRIGKQITEATLVNGNKIKKMYMNLINDELMAYKNIISKANAKITKLQNKFDSKVAANNKKIAKAISANEDKVKQIYEDLTKDDLAAIENIKNEFNEQISNLKNEFDLKISGNKNQIIELSADKKENAEKIDALKKENQDLKAKFNQEIKEIKAKRAESLASAKAKLAESKMSASVKIQECKAEFKAESSIEFAALKKEIKDLKVKLDQDIKEIKSERDELLVPAKAKLAESKKNASVKVKEYKAEIKKEYVEKILEVKQKYQDNPIDKQTLKDELKALTLEHKEAIAPLKLKLKDRFISNDDKALTQKELAQLTEAYEIKASELNDKINAKKLELAAVKGAYIDKKKVTHAEAKRQALEIMRQVGIPFPEKRFRQYPFEFSGGMRQRIVIAIALTANPDILICDEPTTALDVTIQAQILELINKLKRERHLSCIFITHDLGVVANMADRVAVMYAGKIVEYGNVDEIFYEPKHPYTWALLSSIPDVDSKEKLDAIPGTPPNMIYPPVGDAFAARSKYAMEIDYKAQPPFFKVSDTHYAATWLLHPNAPKVEMPKIVSERIKNATEGGK